jgi:uncharacterized protein YcbX
MVGILAGIYIYPVKSCRSVSLKQTEIANTGLKNDRLFQVIGTDGNPLTQRQHPALATVQPSFTDERLLLEVQGQPVLDVSIPKVNDTTANSVLGVPVAAADLGDEAADWFSKLLDVPARLVGMTDQSECRLPIPGVDMTLSFADAASVLVANSASLDWLSERAAEPFGMDRFRPNLIVDTDEPWVEDTWRQFSIGSAELGHGFAWPRCAIPQIDQVNASRHKEPAKVLKQHRWCSQAPSMPESLRPLFEGNALFGVGCSAHPIGAKIAIGDDVRVNETGTRIIPMP